MRRAVHESRRKERHAHLCACMFRLQLSSEATVLYAMRHHDALESKIAFLQVKTKAAVCVI